MSARTRHSAGGTVWGTNASYIDKLCVRLCIYILRILRGVSNMCTMERITPRHESLPRACFLPACAFDLY